MGLLIREYRECYEALCDALERGGDLGECVYAIEKAVRDKGIEIKKEPMGVILDRGDYGMWVENGEQMPEEGEAVGSVVSPLETVEGKITTEENNIEVSTIS